MSNHSRVLFTAEFAVAIFLLALVLGYGWIRAMNYPFTLRQRKMWMYYVLFISAIPVASPLWAALTLWGMVPIKESGAIVIFLLLVWMLIAFYIVRQMSKPGGRFNQERDRTE